jgi:predicted nucleic acid-binding Zn ribbon protein
VKANRSSVRRSAETAPARCADILESSLQGLGFGRVIRHLALLRAWDRAIAVRIREQARVEDFRGGCLYLCVEDPIWMHELHMLRHQLKTILNKEVGEPAVGEIVLRIGRTRQYPSARRTHRGRPRIPAVPPEVEANMAKLLSPLGDLPCRDAVQRLFQRWVSRSQ